MILELRFANFLSYKEETVFFMTSSSIKEKNLDLNTKPIFFKGEEGILKTAAILGPNGGGKSNLLKAFQFFVNTILNKQEDFWQNFKYKNSNPFVLNSKSKLESTNIELSFVIQNIEYSYGFEILENKIQQEWLYKKQERETKIFSRNKQDFEINGEYKIFKQLKENKMIREDALMLSVSAQFNDSTARDILNYFENYLKEIQLKNYTFYLG